MWAWPGRCGYGAPDWAPVHSPEVGTAGMCSPIAVTAVPLRISVLGGFGAGTGPAEPKEASGRSCPGALGQALLRCDWGTCRMGRIPRGHISALMPCVPFPAPRPVPTPPISLFTMTKSPEERAAVNIAVRGREWPAIKACLRSGSPPARC